MSEVILFENVFGNVKSLYCVDAITLSLQKITQKVMYWQCKWPKSSKF